MTIPCLKAKSLDGIPQIRHGFFTRQGGVSTGLYASLNCGLGSKDDGAAVTANRALVAQVVHAKPENLTTVYQVHSAEALIVDAPFTGVPPQADALVTATPGLAVGALAADCAPVLFASADGRVVAAAHAGWKGAVGGILESTLGGMEYLGAARETITAAIGPCIAQVSYEVGVEFRETVLQTDAAYAAFFQLGKQGRYQFDLPGFVRHRLEAAGTGHIEVLEHDTYGDPKRFFSYRRATHAGDPDYGRQISAIAIGFPE